MEPHASSESSKFPPLSYADRAKQGQKQAPKAPPPNIQSSQRVQKDSSLPSPTAQNGSNPSDSPPALGSNPQISLTKAIDNPSPSPLKSSFQSESSRNVQNDVKIEQTDPSSHFPQLPSQKTSGPPMNVWNTRKERMARSTQVPSTPSLSSGPRPPAETAQNVSHSPPPSFEPPRNESLAQKQEHPNGHNVTSAEHLAPPKPPSSVPQDLTDWPTVGAQLSPAPVPVRDAASGNSGTSDITKTVNSKEATVSNPKKGEKQKWIPIPAEELRETADALRLQNRGPTHSRPRPQQAGVQGTASGSSSTPRSGRNSQQQSRTHSAAGVRHTPSHSGSAAQSQPHSRTGSVHSSPRQASFRGGRRLPEDRANGSFNRSARSSRATSPQRQMRAQANANPHPHPSFAQHVSPDPASYPHNPSHDPTIYEPIPVPATFYPPPMSAGPTHPHSYQSTHATNSPASHPYPLPYSATPPYPPGPYPPPHYPMYPPHYPYSYPNHYMQWAPGQEHLYAAGPIVSPGPILPPPPLNPASPDVNASLPPPTMISRPPPPGQSDAVAGYRDIGFVLPPPVTYEQPDQADESKQNEGGTRLISFGSINLATSQSPSSNVASPPSLAAASGTLGLDVNGAELEGSADQVSGNLGIERQFTAFTIGVTSDDAGPSRSRSKTAPVARVSLPSRDRVETAPAALQTEPSSTSDLSSIGFEPSSLRPLEDQKVVDLTEPPATKWEFGTANSSIVANVQGPMAVDLQQQNRPEYPSFPPNGLHPEMHPPVFIEQPYPPPIPQPPHMGYAPFSPVVPGPSVSQSPPSATSPYPPSAPPMSSPSRSNDDFQVKNFGYGFGRGVAPGVLPPPRSDEPREFHPREYYPPQGGRPRRGSYGGFERGGRRGRGHPGGRGSGRGFSRGGNFQHHQHHQSQQHRTPPFTVMPQTIPTEPVYYAPPISQPPISGTVYYHAPPPFEPYYQVYPAQPPPSGPAISQSQKPGPPPPAPTTVVPFPKGSREHDLLGQLEYYFSPDNLAKDFWLRKQMDPEGWLDIPLIVGFPRLQSMQAVESDMRELMALSSLLEMDGNRVRPHQWRRYIIPNTSTNVVEGETVSPVQNYGSGSGTVPSLTTADENVEPSEEEAEEDYVESEDDIQFDLGKEANLAWTPGRPTA